MAYADYEFYIDCYRGSRIPEADFARLAERATEYIDFATLGTAMDYPDTRQLVKKACCAVAEAYQTNEQGGGVVSETVGKITRNYAAGVSTTPTEEQRLYRAISRYLLQEGLLYRGVD